MSDVNFERNGYSEFDIAIALYSSFATYFLILYVQNVFGCNTLCSYKINIKIAQSGKLRGNIVFFINTTYFRKWTCKLFYFKDFL